MVDRLGTVQIAPQVLATIAQLTSLSVPGVARMHHDLGDGVDRLFKGKTGRDGVAIEIVDDAVSVDLSLVGAADVNLYKVGREVQAHVARAITDMVGMPVLAVNVHFEEIADPLED